MESKDFKISKGLTETKADNLLSAGKLKVSFFGSVQKSQIFELTNILNFRYVHV